MMNEFIKSIMTKNPISLNKNAKLVEVKNIFDNNRIHHIPIVDDENNLIGLLTTYDLWKINKHFDEYGDTTVGSVMSQKTIRVNADDKIGTAAELFLDRRFHALPVVEGEKLVGIITTFDILRYEFRKEYDHPILYTEVYEGIRAVS